MVEDLVTGLGQRVQVALAHLRVHLRVVACTLKELSGTFLFELLGILAKIGNFLVLFLELLYAGLMLVETLLPFFKQIYDG